MTLRRISVIAGGLVGFAISATFFWWLYNYAWPVPQYEDATGKPLSALGGTFTRLLLASLETLMLTLMGALSVNKLWDRRKVE